MYDTEGRESLEESAQAPLIEQLERDDSGELRDRLIDELQVAAQEIAAALDDEPHPAQAAILHDLLDAVRVSECVLTEVWESFRG
jgi:hypothetical protein